MQAVRIRRIKTGGWLSKRIQPRLLDADRELLATNGFPQGKGFPPILRNFVVHIYTLLN